LGELLQWLCHDDSTILLGHIAVLARLDVVYCYRRNSMVCHHLSAMTVSPTKIAEPIEMPFWIWTQVGQRNHVLDGVHSKPPHEGALFSGDNIGIFLYAVEHRTQWPSCRDFSTCCQPAFWLDGHTSSRVSH